MDLRDAANGDLLDTGNARPSFVYADDRSVRQFNQGVELIYRNGARQSSPTKSELATALSMGTRVEATHHTTPVRGQPVGAAGSQTGVQGVPSNIRDDSGHYRPEAEYTYQYVRDLRAAGNPLRYPAAGGEASTTVSVIGAIGANPALRKGWVGDNPAYYQGELTFTSDQFLATRGNERQARLKKKMLDELSAKS